MIESNFTKVESRYTLVSKGGSESYSAFATAGKMREHYSCPTYKALIRSGGNATTYFSANEQTITPGGGSVTRTGFPSADDYWISSGNAVAAIAVNTPLIPPDDAADMAVESFVQKARDVRTTFNGGTFVGELRKTIGMIKKPASSIQDLAKNYVKSVDDKTRRRIRKRDLPKVLSDTWLEYAFGWAPLISETNKALDTLQNMGTPQISFVSGSGRASKFEQHQYFATFGTPYLVGEVTQFWNQTNDCQVYGVVKGSPNGSPDQIATKLGFNAEEFIPTVYELIPFSFLLDYFTNIGNAVSVFSFNTSALAWCAITERASTKLTSVHMAIPGAGSGRQTFSSQYKRVLRRPAFAINCPDVRLELPNLPRQFANVAALFTSANIVQKRLSKIL